MQLERNEILERYSVSFFRLKCHKKKCLISLNEIIGTLVEGQGHNVCERERERERPARAAGARTHAGARDLNEAAAGRWQSRACVRAFRNAPLAFLLARPGGGGDAAIL